MVRAWFMDDSDEDQKLEHVADPLTSVACHKIVPWVLVDADFCKVPQGDLDPRMTVFGGGIPRPCSAFKLATLQNLFGGDVSAGDASAGDINAGIDREYHYPTVSGRICFSNNAFYLNASSSRFAEMAHASKMVEINPFVLNNQLCDICEGERSRVEFGEYFCPNIICLKYHCSDCWDKVHFSEGFRNHKPLLKEGIKDGC